MNRNAGRGRSVSVALALLGSLVTGSQAGGEQPSYSPYAGATYATQVYWGDTHVHSSWSPDAWIFGNRRFEPDTAYRFAAGEDVVASGGMRVQLRRPLDFLLVSDHSEYVGLFPRLSDEDPALLSTDTGRRWSDLLAKGEVQALFEEFMDALINNRDVRAGGLGKSRSECGSPQSPRSLHGTGRVRVDLDAGFGQSSSRPGVSRWRRSR